MSKNILRLCIFIISAGFIFYGLLRGEDNIIFKKAVRICLECIGLG